MAVDVKSATARQLEAYARDQGYDIEVNVKEGKPSLWVVTLSAMRDRRKFSHSASQHYVSGQSEMVERSAQEAYLGALAGAVAKARAYANRLS